MISVYDPLSYYCFYCFRMNLFHIAVRVASFTDSELQLAGKIDDLQSKYPSLDVIDISKKDPSGPSNKYLSWMLKQLDSDKSVNESDLYPTVEFFHKNIQRFPKKDINQYKSLKELEDTAKLIPSKSKRQETKEIKTSAPKIYEDDTSLVVRPDSKESCCIYGSGTKWCITMENASYYEEYVGANVIFYYIISKVKEENDPLNKIAIAIQRDLNNKNIKTEFFDAEDGQLEKSELNDVHNFDHIVSICEFDAEKRPMGVLARLENNLCTEEELEKLSNDENESIRKKVAEKAKSPSILEKLSNDKEPSIRCGVAENQNISIEVLEKLSNDKDYDVRCRVTENSNTPKEILEKLSNDEDDSVRWCVTSNPNTSKETLEKLSNDEDYYVRRGVASNSNTSKEILEKLSNDKNPDVRYYVAGNPNTSKEVLEKLSNDEHANIRDTAHIKLKSK